MYFNYFVDIIEHKGQRDTTNTINYNKGQKCKFAFMLLEFFDHVQLFVIEKEKGVKTS